MKRSIFFTAVIIFLGFSFASAQEKLDRAKPLNRKSLPAANIQAQPKISPSQTDLSIDPNHLAVTSPKTFRITDPQLGTRPYRQDMALCELSRGGFAMVYEAVVDDTNGGGVQALLAYLSPTLQQKGTTMPVTVRHGTTVLKSIDLHEFADESLLLTYLERSESNSVQYSINSLIISKGGSITWGPKELSKFKPDQRLLGVTLMQGGLAAMVTFQQGQTAFAAVIGSTGKYIVRPQALSNIPVPGAAGGSVQSPGIQTAPRLLADGLVLLGARCNGAGGMVYLDPYGQWVGNFLSFRMRESKPMNRDILDVLPLPGSERYLLLLANPTNSLVVMNEPLASHAVHQFGTEVPLSGERFWASAWGDDSALVLRQTPTGNAMAEISAMVVNNLGAIKKTDQVVLSNVSAPITPLHLRNGDMLLLGGDSTGNGFVYTFIRNTGE